MLMPCCRSFHQQYKSVLFQKSASTRYGESDRLEPASLAEFAAAARGGTGYMRREEKSMSVGDRAIKGAISGVTGANLFDLAYADLGDIAKLADRGGEQALQALDGVSDKRGLGHDAEQAQPGRCLGRSRQRRVGRHDQHQHDEHRQQQHPTHRSHHAAPVEAFL